MTDEPVRLPLETASADTFTPHVGSEFSAGGSALRLVGVRRHAETPHLPRTSPFTLDLVGPPPPLECDTHELAHAELGIVEVFIVPVGQDADGVHYEVLFA